LVDGVEEWLDGALPHALNTVYHILAVPKGGQCREEASAGTRIANEEICLAGRNTAVLTFYHELLCVGVLFD